MTQDDKQKWQGFVETIKKASSLEKLKEIELKLFSRKKGLYTLSLKKLQEHLSDHEKKELGKTLNVWKEKLTKAVSDKRLELVNASLSDLSSKDRIDVSVELPKKERGHLHLIPSFIEEVENVFGRMGFDTEDGPEIETEELNFDLLNFPKDHPARDAMDTFFLKGTKKEHGNLLRTHTSPGQIRYMRNREPPFRAIFPGKVYRRDADATHSPMFHQLEGLMVGEDISLTHLKGIMIAAVKELISDNVEFRFRTGYFPFVEPGLELDMRWRGKREKSREGEWMEMAGCGMVHPTVLKNGGIDPKKWQGFAFGFGIERLLMIKHHIPDLRLFYAGDMRFLRQF